MVRRGWSDGWGVDAGNGLILEAGRLVMFVQVGFQGKGLVAALAFEVFESRMSLHVGTEVGAIGE